MKRTIRIRVSVVRVRAPGGVAGSSADLGSPGRNVGEWGRSGPMAPHLTDVSLAGALPASRCEAWLRAIGPPEGPSRPLSALHALDAAEVLRVVADSAIGARLERALGPEPVCDVDQSWVRHGRPPHSWHQDGALRFDFLAHAGRPLPTGAPLEMLTCWIALTPCGEDAPGLEWVDVPLDGLLPPAELTDESVGARFTSDRFVRPRLRSGDALVFDGLLLHRTHLTSAMRRPRASLELRFFRAGRVPARVAADRFETLRRSDAPGVRGSWS